MFLLSFINTSDLIKEENFKCSKSKKGDSYAWYSLSFKNGNDLDKLIIVRIDLVPEKNKEKIIEIASSKKETEKVPVNKPVLVEEKKPTQITIKSQKEEIDDDPFDHVVVGEEEDLDAAFARLF